MPDNTAPSEDYLKTRIRDALRSDGQAHAWLGGLVFKLEKDRLLVSFIHAYLAEWFRSHKINEFEKILHSIGALKIFYDWKKTNSLRADRGENMRPIAAKKAADANEDFFAAFITNEKNSLALEMARMAANPDSHPRIALVLCGAAGTGKTHLLNGIKKSLLGHFPDLIACDAGAFLARGCAPGDSRHIEFFWRRHHALILDNLRDIVHAPVWVNMLAAYIDGFYAESIKSSVARLVLAFTGPGRELAILGERLRAKLENGVVMELREADLDIRLRYLENASRALRLGLSREQILMLGRQCASIPMLAGIIQKIELFRRIRGHAPTLAELEGLNERENGPKEPDWRDILARVSRALHVKPEDVLGPGRQAEVALARQITMYLCRQKLGLSYPDLGRLMGGRDHSTVIHAIKKIGSLAKTDKDMRNLLTELENARF